MPRGSLTSLFVSSTCYDLAQVRADLHEFATNAGLEPVLSEFSTFPVKPSTDTVSTCLEAIRDKADLFTLIVGGRYGSIADAGLSVTNLEYLEAAAKGIPKYVFVKRDILTLLPIWKKNPDADFSSAVDSPKLFEFVETLQKTGSTWVFPFTSAQDITSTLRQQFSYLLADCLNLRQKLYPPEEAIKHLGAKALKTYLEKPKGWEYLTLAHCLEDEVERHKNKKYDAELGICFGPAIHKSDPLECLRWIADKMGELSILVENLETAIKKGVEPAVGPQGSAGNIARIIHLGKRFGDGYETALDWTLEFSRVRAPEELGKALTLAAHASSHIIREMNEYAMGLAERMRTALMKAQPGETANFVLHLTVPDMTELSEEMQRLFQEFQA